MRDDPLQNIGLSRAVVQDPVPADAAKRNDLTKAENGVLRAVSLRLPLQQQCEGYERKVGLRIGLCSAAVDSMVSYLMKSQRWQQYATGTNAVAAAAAVAATGTAAATPVRWLLREMASFPVSPVWAGFGWMWAGDAMYYGMMAAAEKYSVSNPPSTATGAAAAAAAADGGGGRGGAATATATATASVSDGAEEVGGEKGNEQNVKTVGANGKKLKALNNNKSSNTLSGMVVQLTARCAAAGLAAPCTALMLRSVLSTAAAAASGSSFSALSFLTSSFSSTLSWGDGNGGGGGGGGGVNVLLVTVGCQIVSVALQDAVASCTLQFLKHQLQPKQPLREWLDGNGIEVAPTTAMYIPPLLATLTADVVSTLLLNPLEMTVVRMHADAMTGSVGAVVPMPSARNVLGLYSSSVPGIAGSLLCETVLRGVLIYGTMGMLQKSSVVLGSLHAI